MKRETVILRLGIASILMMSVLAACQKKEDVVSVQERAIARWNFLVERNAGKAYEYLSPGYRSTVSKDQYVRNIAQRAMSWSGVKPISVQCKEDVCSVRLTIQYSLIMPMLDKHMVKSEAPVTEKWIKSDGEWYFLPNLKVSQGAEQPAQEETPSGNLHQGGAEH